MLAIKKVDIELLVLYCSNEKERMKWIEVS